MQRPKPLNPGRIRVARGAYGWTDLRVITGGWLERLGPDAALTYLFFCAVGNTQGISFWSRGRIAHILGVDRGVIDNAIGRLVRADLVAAHDNVVQVLSLPQIEPSFPPVSPGPGDDVAVTDEEIQGQQAAALAQLAPLLGARSPAPEIVKAVATGLARQARKSTASALDPNGGEARG